MPILSERELLQICRKYEITCTVCSTANAFFRLKPDACRPGNQEGDGHPRAWKWSKPGFDAVDPKQFFWGVCQKCRFAGELDEADFRTCDKDPDGYKAQFSSQGLERLVSGALSGKTAVQALGRLISSGDLLASAVAQFHLGIFSHCLRHEILPGSLARYYLRLAWLYRDQEVFYRGANAASLKEQLVQLKPRWEAELPRNKEYPVPPGLALDEGMVARTRDTPPQVEAASREERRANVDGSFEGTADAAGRAVVLVDDVATTGSTLSACAAALKAAGAASVWGLVLAREG